jgi:predicted unusual protein kinase regulating ubiquinone biosynthesis (AarF/ABC1/UbiB family)
VASRVPGSRLGRLTRLGWLSRNAVPVAWRRLREAAHARPEERAAIALRALDRHADLAEEAFRTLGDLKGIALKVGQMLSYMDGALPEAYRAVYQKALSRLQQEAPALPWRAVEPVLRAELGRPIREVFSSFEPEPFAAASIGQVHRATLPDGCPVAVKVQYPGIEKAMKADLKNAKLFQALLAPVLGLAGRGALQDHLEEVMAEIRLRLLEELDYTREARMQERFRTLLADEPLLAIPRVFPECSSRRVLTTEYRTGRTLDEVCRSALQQERDRHAAVLNRVMIRSLFEFQLFNADPHPGNYLFPEDGRVVWLDFGCVKEIPDWMCRAIRRTFRAAIQATRSNSPGDWAEFDEAIREAFRLDPEEHVIYELARDFLLYCLRPYLKDEPFQFTPDYTGESIDRVLDAATAAAFPKGSLPRIPNLPPIPADFTFLNRLQWGFFSVLAMLRARGNWHQALPPEVRGSVTLARTR